MAFIWPLSARINDTSVIPNHHIPSRIHIIEEFPENKRIVTNINVAVKKKYQVEGEQGIIVHQPFSKIIAAPPGLFLDLHNQNPVATCSISLEYDQIQNAFTPVLNI